MVKSSQLAWLLWGQLALAAAAIVMAGDANDSALPQEVLDALSRSGAALDEALSVWEARTLAVAWPHLAPALQSPCKRHLALMLRALAHTTPEATTTATADAFDADNENSQWATRALDASGRYARRLHSGNGFWLGSRDLCRQLDVAAAGSPGDADLAPSDAPPFRFSYHVAKMTIEHHLLEQERAVELGLCMPAACGVEDTRAALEAVGRTAERNLTVESVRLVGGAGAYSFWADPRFSAMLCATLLVATFVIVATIYDFWIQKNHSRKEIKTFKNNNDSNCIHERCTGHSSCNKLTLTNSTNGISAVKLNLGTFRNGTSYSEYVLKDINEHVALDNTFINKENCGWKWRDDVEADSIAKQVILSFSLRTNLQKLCSLNGGDDTLTPIHGLRVFTLMWIVLVHSCLIAFQNADNKKFRKKAEQDFLYQTLSSGTYSVDTFFVISGMLVSFLYFRTVSKMSVKELTFTEGYKAGILQFLGLTAYRFARLTPTYLYVLGIVSVTTKYYHDNSVMELPTNDHITCDKYWWRNILYINTFYVEKERCMVWSWYLANDTQFYTIGSILLIIAVSYFQIAVAIAGMFLLGTWTTTAILAINAQHRTSIEDPFANYEELYDKPWVRIGPYLIGMCAGWILCKTNCQLKLHKGWIVSAWIAALLTMSSVVYGLYLVEFGPVLSAIYVALGHSAWALSVAWIVIACSSNCGGIVDKILSWPYLFPISRLSYCTYLIHPQVIRIILLNYDSSFHITIGMMGTIFGGFLLASYLAALFITLTFEAPVVSLLRIAHPMRRKKVS